MDPDDPHALDRLLAHQARVETLIKRFLPAGFRYGHDLCYPRESDDFVPAAERLDALLTAYGELLNLIAPKPHDLTCYGFLACMEMMDLNELVIGYLSRAEAIPPRPELCPLLDASIRNLQTVFDGEYHDDDSGKRFYRLREMLCRREAGAEPAAMTDAHAPHAGQNWREPAWVLNRIDDAGWRLLLREIEFETLPVVLWSLKDRQIGHAVVRNLNRRAASMLIDELMKWRGRDPDQADAQTIAHARDELAKVLAAVRRLIDEGRIDRIDP